MTVSISPNGRNVYELDRPTHEVLVGTADGIITLTRSDPGASWQESGRELRGKHIASIAVEPRSRTIFAGTHGSGLWASDDGGQTWERRDRGIQQENFYALNYTYAGDQVRVYAGTEPAHLWVSEDLGRSWRELASLRETPSVNDWTFPAPPHEGHVKSIVFDPQDPNIIYVGVEVGGAFKSTDAGATWQELNRAGFYLDVHRLMVNPQRPSELFMATGRGLYRSVDAGITWEDVPLPGISGPAISREAESQQRNEGISYPDPLVIAPGQPELMFTAGAAASPGAWRRIDGAFPRVARSRDGGRTWTYLEGGLPREMRANIEAMTLVTYPGGLELFAGTTDGDVFYSPDEGEYWATIAQALPPVSKGGHYRGLRPDWVPAA